MENYVVTPDLANFYTAWPTPYGGYEFTELTAMHPGLETLWIGRPGYNNGVGRGGMYSSWLYIAAIYADVKFLDGKLELKGEYDRIWGTGYRNSVGDAFNAWLDSAAWVYSSVPGNYRLPNEIKIDGHTVYADLSYDFDVAKVGVAFLFGSGEKYWRAYTQHHYNFNTTGNGDFHWGNVIVPGDAGLLGAAYAAPLGLGSNPENITSVKLYWSVDPIEKLDIHGAFIWAQYTQPVGRYAGGVTAGKQPFYGHPMNYLSPNGTVYTPVRASRELGWEIDAGLTYDIMEGLSLNSEFGVLFTGDAFDYITPLDGATHNWGPIYRWVNTLTYEF